MDTANTVFVKVAGFTFECPRKCLDNDIFKEQTLYKMCTDAESSGKPLYFTVSRSMECFVAILNYYQTEKLHMPLDMCPGQFKDELEYWRIDPYTLERCCLYRYFTFLDNMETHTTFTDSQKPKDVLTYNVPVDGGFRSWRQRVWKIVSNQEKTFYAKVYAALLLTMVVVSIVGMAYSTVKSLRRSLTICEYLEYLRATDSEYHALIQQAYSHIDCHAESESEDATSEFSLENLYSNPWWVDYWYTDTGTTEATTTENSAHGINLPVVSAQHYFFDVLEYVTVAFFTFDSMLRLFSCPSIWRYFTSVINIMDLIALVASYIYMGIRRHLVKERYMSDSWVYCLEAIQVFRILRILRLAKNVRASRVLSFSVRQNANDMTLLVLFLFLSTSLFSILLYFIESSDTIPSIPQGWYWAVVTLTTVGYGDISPKSGPGRFVACICAITGVLLLAITLPMFVNNFMTLYHFSSIDDAIETKKEAAVKRESTPSQCSNDWIYLKRRHSSQVVSLSSVKE